jgi:uncharacterized protein with NRDE domain
MAVDAAPELPLVIAANRDEFFTRSTAAAGWWDDIPQVLAGRDLEGGGTWMGVTRAGRFAAVTNYRDLSIRVEDPRSRGAAVRGFLEGGEAAEEYLTALAREGHRYGPFSMVAGDPSGLWWTSSVTGEVARITPGVHALSNHLLDTPWPKVQRATTGLGAALDGPRDRLTETLMELLSDSTPGPAEALPDTGVGATLEAGLSPIHVALPGYGTRCSTVVIVHRSGRVDFRERSLEPSGRQAGMVEESFRIDG